MRKTILMTSIFVVLIATMAGAILAQDDTAPGAWLGVGVAETADGVTISQVVAGSPADAAGLLVNDVITSFNGEAVGDFASLAALVSAASPGDEVEIVALRGEEEVTIDVTLGETPASVPGQRGQRGPQGRVPAIPAMPMFRDAMPLRSMDILGHGLFAQGLEAVDGGYAVTADFPALGMVDLQEGDVITAVNGQPINAVDIVALAQELAAEDSEGMVLSVQRGDETIEVTLGRVMSFDMRAMPRFHSFGDGFDMEDIPWDQMPEEYRGWFEQWLPDATQPADDAADADAA
jgi:S1-C subfamily serine protease